MLAGMLLSPKLWLSSRAYPLVPPFRFIHPLPSPFDLIAFATVIGVLIALLFTGNRIVMTAAIALLLLEAIQDQTRWQPWFYQYLVMLLAIALAGAAIPEAAMKTCRLIVAATYIWSGLAKLNPHFAAEVFPWLIEPLRLPVAFAFLSALAEFGIGVALLSQRFRRPALWCAIAMHIFILLSIGPFGHRINFVVWPWNLAMIAFLLILFRTNTPGREFWFYKVALLLFGVLPALSAFNLYDQYLSSSLYSGNRASGVIHLSDAALVALPESIAEYASDEGLDISQWAFLEMNVPAYPEPRVYREVTRRVCGYSKDSSGVELVIQEKLALLNGGRRRSYSCSDLRD